MKKFLTALFIAAVAAFQLTAQNAIKVQAPNMVAADEQFNVTFTIEGEKAPTDFNWNPGDDFQLVWGPQKGSSSSVSIINGKRTSSSQTTYTYVLLPKKTGSFTIPAATAMLKGDKISSQPVAIEVLSGGASAGQSSPSGSSSSSQKASSTGDIDSGDLFIKMALSRTNVVVGEPLTATLKLYQRVNVSAFEDVKFPTFTGFWSQEAYAPKNIEFNRENVGDNIYNVAILRSWTLIPQQSGKLTIDPAELVCLVNIRVSSGTGSIFDSFFQDDYRTVRKRLSTGAIAVNVSALPAGAPASFGGGVGQFSMNASLSTNELKAHDAASLKVVVSGKGNVALLQAPKINFPPDFEVYDVKASDSADKNSKIFEYPFIPRSHGDFEVGPVEYTYYDTQSRKYVTLSAGPYPLKVERGEGSSASSAPVASSAPQGAIRKDVKDIDSDIRYIATTAPAFRYSGSAFLGSALSWVLAILYIIIGAIVYFLVQRGRARRNDVRATRVRAAAKMARKRLALAGDYLSKDLYTAFYEELHRALLGFASDKLGLDSADLSKDSIKEAFVSRGVAEETAGRFNELLDACEFARYAPSSGHEAMNAHYEGAVDAISLIESDMKRKKPVSGAAAAVITALLLVCGPACHAAETYVDSLWRCGCEAYASGDWQTAGSSWQSIEAAGLESAKLSYNIGNAFFKEGDFPHAILYYERALKQDPSYKDARHNLDFANAMVQDRIEEVPEFFLKTWLRKVSMGMSADTWGLLFHILFALTLALVLLFLLSDGARAKKLGFFGALVALLLAFAAWGFGHSQLSQRRNAGEAIIMRPVTSVKSSPGDGSSKDLFILHEGTKVRLLDTVGEWNNIELADGRQGWIRAMDIEII